MRLRRGLALAAAVAPPAAMFLASSPSRVHAAEDAKPTARLSWVRAPGTESCVDAPGLEKDVSARLGREAFGKDPSLQIDAIVTREGNVWKAQLFVRDAKGASLGNRTIDSDAVDCASLGRAVALGIALAIDPDASATAPPVSTPESVPSASASVPRKKKPAPPPPPPPAARPIVVAETDPASVAVRGALAAGLMPRAAPGVALSFEPYYVRGLRPVIGATYLPVQRTPDGAIGVGMTFGSIGACATTSGDLRTGRVGIDGCFALLAGATHSAVYTLDPASPGDRAWFGASFGVHLRARLFEGLFLDFAVDGVVPITRHRFSGVFANGAEAPLFTQPLFSLLPAFGLGWQFR